VVVGQVLSCVCNLKVQLVEEVVVGVVQEEEEGDMPAGACPQ
jgi:hypothetical protein